MADLVQYYGTGRRKSSVARVFLRPGSGNFTINRKGFEEYFVTKQQRVSAKRPLVLVEMLANFDVLANVSGGGVSAQADAVKMGISRALLEFNIELRKTLKADGLLSRDARIKERKKYGQKGARKRFQFSKRESRLFLEHEFRFPVEYCPVNPQFWPGCHHHTRAAGA